MSGRSQLVGSSRAEPSTASDFAVAAVPWLASRALVLGALAVARHVVDHLGTQPRPIALHQGLLAWDAAFYGDIARGGYDAVARDGLRFFPLLPLAGRAVGLLPFVDARGGVVVVANLSALVAAVLLVRLVTFETGDRGLATRSARDPAARTARVRLRHGLRRVAAVRARARDVPRVAPRAMVVGRAGRVRRRPLPPGRGAPRDPCLIEAVRAVRRRRGPRVAPVIATIAPLAGLASYLLWARDRTGDLWLVVRLQNSRTLRGGTASPFTSVGHAFHELVSGDRVGYGLHAVTAVLVVVLVVVAARKLPFSYTAYAAASVLVAFCARNLDSVERYSLATFPLVIAASVLLRRATVERIVYLILAGGLVAGSVLAFTGSLVP